MNLEEMRDEELRAYFESIPVEDLLHEIQNPTLGAYTAHKVAVSVFNERRGKEIREERDKKKSTKEAQKLKDRIVVLVAALATVGGMLFTVWDHFRSPSKQQPTAPQVKLVQITVPPLVEKIKEGKRDTHQILKQVKPPINHHDSTP